MTDSSEIRACCFHIPIKWMAQRTDLHNPLLGSEYCLDPEFHAYDHTTRPEI